MAGLRLTGHAGLAEGAGHRLAVGAEAEGRHAGGRAHGAGGGDVDLADAGLVARGLDGQAVAAGAEGDGAVLVGVGEHGERCWVLVGRGGHDEEPVVEVAAVPARVEHAVTVEDVAVPVGFTGDDLVAGALGDVDAGVVRGDGDKVLGPAAGTGPDFDDDTASGHAWLQHIGDERGLPLVGGRPFVTTSLPVPVVPDFGVEAAAVQAG